MKHLALPALFFCAVSALAQDVPQLSSEAQRAYLTGDIDTAKAKFRTVLQIDPTNVAARNYLRMIATQEKASGGHDLAKQLHALILPSVKFKDATFSEALDFLKQQAAKQSITVSFVSQLSPEANQKQVTLNLSNVPFTEAVRYLCELNGAQAVIEKYAIVIRKAGDSAGAASPTAAQ